MSKEKDKKKKRNYVEAVAKTRFIFVTVILFSLGILIGREVYRYEVKHVDDNRVRQLIEALEKKPVRVEIHPLVPFRVPSNRVPPRMNTRPPDKLTIVRKDSSLCLSLLPNQNPINVHRRY